MRLLEQKIKIIHKEDLKKWLYDACAESAQLLKMFKDENGAKYFMPIIGFVFVFAFWHFGLLSAVLWAIFFTFYFYQFDARILTALALTFLAGASIAIVSGKGEFADSFTVNAYFLLVMVVVLEIKKEYFEKKAQEALLDNSVAVGAVEEADFSGLIAEQPAREIVGVDLSMGESGDAKKLAKASAWLRFACLVTLRNLKTQPILWLFSVLIVSLTAAFYFVNFHSAKQDAPTDASNQLFQMVKFDTDKDGLTDDEELRLGTNPHMSDTDSDGLSDFEEVKKYHTDPLKQDTDGDGFFDLVEIKNGYDPNGPGKLQK